MSKHNCIKCGGSLDTGFVCIICGHINSHIFPKDSSVVRTDLNIGVSDNNKKLT
jgi:hypothetical protein